MDEARTKPLDEDEEKVQARLLVIERDAARAEALLRDTPESDMERVLRVASLKGDICIKRAVERETVQSWYSGAEYRIRAIAYDRFYRLLRGELPLGFRPQRAEEELAAEAFIMDEAAERSGERAATYMPIRFFGKSGNEYHRGEVFNGHLMRSERLSAGGEVREALISLAPDYTIQNPRYTAIIFSAFERAGSNHRGPFQVVRTMRPLYSLRDVKCWVAARINIATHDDSVELNQIVGPVANSPSLDGATMTVTSVSKI